MTNGKKRPRYACQVARWLQLCTDFLVPSEIISSVNWFCILETELVTCILAGKTRNVANMYFRQLLHTTYSTQWGYVLGWCQTNLGTCQGLLSLGGQWLYGANILHANMLDHAEKLLLQHCVMLRKAFGGGGGGDCLLVSGRANRLVGWLMCSEEGIADDTIP